MKVRIYLDVPYWATEQNPGSLWLSMAAPQKQKDHVRYGIDVVIPTPQKPDKVIETAATEEKG